jgi:BlaI family transcriptional regulator, penicillinase repressor
VTDDDGKPICKTAIHPSYLHEISTLKHKAFNSFGQKALQTAHKLKSTLGDGIEWSPCTVKTLLSRLVKKGTLGFITEGRKYFYTPRISESDCIRDELNSFLARVYDGALTPMIVAFLNEHTVMQR